MNLDAVYYDTADERLAAAALTLRRRTGGSDAGWHLKVPVAPGVRDEIREPLSDTVPRTLAGLVRARVREAELAPVVRLRSDRDVRHLVDAEGKLLAEVSVDAVRAERLTEGGGTAQWTEIEVELADGGDPVFLDKVEKRLRKAGVRPSSSSSSWPGRCGRRLPGPRRRSGRRPRPPRRTRSPRATTSSPTSAPSATRSSNSTRPYGRTRTTRCTGCGSPPGGCAARSGRSGRSSTAGSPTRSARNSNGWQGSWGSTGTAR